jgi:glycosyltransferase involved in cell wall biosynthesis
MHNSAPYIANTLDSIARQSLDCIREIVVVDDASTDNSRELVSGYGDPRIRLVSLQTNQGVSVARNVGVQSAQFDWVAFNDADDVWLDDKLARQFALLSAHPDAVGCVGGNGRLHRDGRQQWRTGFGPWSWCPEEAPDLTSPPYFRPVLDGHVYIQSLVVRRDIALSEKFKPELRLMQDQDYFLRLGRHGRFVCTESPVFLYRLGFSNTTAHGRMRARDFLANRDYLYLASDAAVRNLPEPDVADHLGNYIPADADVELFEVSQRFRHFNTIWVNRGLPSALVNLTTMFAQHPLQTWRFIMRRIRHWVGH